MGAAAAPFPSQAREAHGELYFRRVADGVVHTFSPWAEDLWRFTRMTPRQLHNINIVLHRGRGGWEVCELSPSSKRVLFLIPCCTERERHGQHPPLGPWRRPGLGLRFWALTEYPPEPPTPLELPLTLETPFACLCYTEAGSVGSMSISMRAQAIEDSYAELLEERVTAVLLNIASRAGMVLLTRFDLQDGLIPSRDHIRSFISFVSTPLISELMLLTLRGCAYVLEPRGVKGYAFLGIVKMIQTLLPAPHPECVVHDCAAATAFLESLRPADLYITSPFAASPRELPDRPLGARWARQLDAAQPDRAEADEPDQVTPRKRWPWQPELAQDRWARGDVFMLGSSPRGSGTSEELGAADKDVAEQVLETGGEAQPNIPGESDIIVLGVDTMPGRAALQAGITKPMAPGTVLLQHAEDPAALKRPGCLWCPASCST